MDKRLIFLFLFLFLSASFAAVVNINSCGITNIVDGNTYNFTNDIYANVGSTITAGGCVVLNRTTAASSAAITLAFNNFAIINNGSSATIGLLINDKITGNFRDIYAVSTNENFSISNFNTAIQIQSNTSSITVNSYLSITNNASFYISNAQNAFISNFTDAAGQTIAVQEAPLYSGNINYRFNFYLCNITKIPLILQGNTSVSGSMGKIYLYTAPNCALQGLVNPTNSILYTVANDSTFYNYSIYAAPLILSNLQFSSNGILNIVGYNATNNGTIAITAKNISYAFNNLTYGSWLYIYPYNYTFQYGTNTYNPYRYGFNATAITNVSGKIYFCIGNNYCNPLTFINDSSFPYYINSPTQLQVAAVQFPYTTLKFFWMMGEDGTGYLQASSSNNGDQYFYLQPQGVYNMEVNGTNQTITYNCPSSFSYCFIQTNGSLVIAPPILSTLFNDVNYTLYWNNGTANISVANNFQTSDVQITSAFSSANSTLTFYGMNITKFYNLTTSQVCFQNETTAAGGILNCSTTGLGQYKIYLWFKSTLYPNTYVVMPYSLYIVNSTGILSAISTLQTANIIPGWLYALFSVLITVIAMGFMSKYLESGAGLIGIVVLWLLTLIWNAPISGDITMVEMSVIATIGGAAWFIIGRYM